MATVVSRDESVAEASDESLKALQPEPTFIEFNGEKIYVKPYKFAQLLRALKHLGNISEVLTLASVEGAELAILRGLADHADDIMELICLSTGLDKEFFEELDSDLGLDLAIMTYNVNESFFATNLLPKLEKLGLFQSSSPEEESQSEAEPSNKKSKAKTGSTSSKS